MQSLFFFLPLFSAQPAQPTSLSLSFFSSPAAQTPPFHQPTFLFRPRSAPPPLCRRQAGPACRGRLPPRGRRGLRESGRCTPPRSLPWRALQGSPAAPIYSFARVLCLPSQTVAAFSAPNPSAAIRALELGAAANRRSSASPRHPSVPGVPPQGEKRRAPFLFLSSTLPCASFLAGAVVPPLIAEPVLHRICAPCRPFHRVSRRPSVLPNPNPSQIQARMANFGARRRAPPPAATSTRRWRLARPPLLHRTSTEFLSSRAPSSAKPKLELSLGRTSSPNSGDPRRHAWPPAPPRAACPRARLRKPS